MKVELRKEYKFISDVNSGNHDLFFIRGNYEKLYPKRKISSLYFDTFNLKLYKDSLNNDVDKSKIRFRQYGGSQTINKEIKINSNLGRLKFIETTNYENFDEIEPFIYKGFLIQPIVLISFDREYFLKKNSRITIDTKLVSKLSKSFNLSQAEYFSTKSIIEYKLKDNAQKNTIFEKLFIDETNSIEDSLFRNPQSFSKYTYSLSKLLVK